jgi:hypothetical protein
VAAYELSDATKDYATCFRLQKVKLAKGDLVAEAHMDFVLDYGETRVLPGDEVYCVAIQHDFEPYHGLGEEASCHALILQRSVSDDGKFWKRIGKFLAPVGWFNEAEPEKLTII